MTETLAVPVEAIAVRLVTLAGVSCEALVYLHTTSGRHLGAETLGERLSSAETLFLPCETAAGVELVNLDQLAYLHCPPGLPEVKMLDELSGFRVTAVLELAHGEALRGQLRYRLPAFACRVSDLLNAPTERFLLLTAADRCCYVNRRAVVRVRTEDSSCQ